MIRTLYEFTYLEASSGSWNTPSEWKKNKITLFPENIKHVQEGTYPKADFDYCHVETDSNSYKIKMSRIKFLTCIGIGFTDLSENDTVTEEPSNV